MARQIDPELASGSKRIPMIGINGMDRPVAWARQNWDFSLEAVLGLAKSDLKLGDTVIAHLKSKLTDAYLDGCIRFSGKLLGTMDETPTTGGVPWTRIEDMWFRQTERVYGGFEFNVYMIHASQERLELEAHNPIVYRVGLSCYGIGCGEITLYGIGSKIYWTWEELEHYRQIGKDVFFDARREVYASLAQISGNKVFIEAGGTVMEVPNPPHCVVQAGIRYLHREMTQFPIFYWQQGFRAIPHIITGFFAGVRECQETGKPIPAPSIRDGLRFFLWTIGHRLGRAR